MYVCKGDVSVKLTFLYVCEHLAQPFRFQGLPCTFTQNRAFELVLSNKKQRNETMVNL